jgi:hypothetical protein
MSRVILAVGGSGQMVLHHYVQLHLLGIIRERFDAYVFDSDEPMRSLACLAEFFADLQDVLGAEAQKQAVPSIRIVRLAPGREGASVAEVLTQERLPEQPGFHHAAQVFFSNDALLQDVRTGLYARPALSAVLSLETALGEFDPLRLPNDAKVVLVCSSIGGTGGGMAIPLLWRLANTPGAQFHLHASLLGDYFVPREGQAVGDDVARFRSNRAMFLKTLEQSIPELKSFALIEEPKMPARDPQKEQKAEYLPWSEESMPYWQAAAATEYLFRESVAAVRENFFERRIRSSQYSGIINRGDAWKRLETRFSLIRSALHRNLFRKIYWEADVRRIWGDSLIDALIRFFVLSRKAGMRHNAKQFLGHLHKDVQEVWDGVPGRYSLAKIFPECGASAIEPGMIRRVGWIASPPGTEPAVLADPKKAFRKMAAAFLYAALRN